MAVIRCRKPTDAKAKPFDKSLLYKPSGEESSKPQRRAEMEKNGPSAGFAFTLTLCIIISRATSYKGKNSHVDELVTKTEVREVFIMTRTEGV